MKKQTLVFGILAVLMMVSFGCSNSTQEEAGDVREEAQELMESAGNDAAELSEAVKEQIRQESTAMVHDIGKVQQRISQRILDIRKEMKTATGEARAQLEEEKNNLEELRDNLNVRTQQLQKDAMKNWEELKANIARELGEAQEQLEQ